ncbi:MAG: aminopeptidase P family N-terminal domain-containing protein, partial [Pseudomonadota bacterium]
MFQSFSDKSQGELGAKRTDALRKELRSRQLDGFVVPRADEHQGEYVGPNAERLAWLTGFTGSAGAAVVLLDKAAIFVDGRYTVQADEQTDGDVFERCHLMDTPITKWLPAQLKAGQRLGFDPWLHTVNNTQQLKKACAKVDAELVAVETNPIDAVWSDQPARPNAPVYAHPTQFAGQSAAEKAGVLSDALKTAGVDAAVLTTPESLAWAFNLRGSDVPHTPICLAFGILLKDGPARIYLDKARLEEDLLRQLEGLAEIRPADAFATDLGSFSGQKVLIDPAWCAMAVKTALKVGGAEIITGADPCLLPKAIKNPVEQEGARIAHVRDGAAMVKFLHWLEREAPSGEITEIDAATKLEGFRVDTGVLKEISFDSISGAGEHAALPHYRVSEASNLTLKPG